MRKKIIPCLDLKNGRVVKGVNFVNFKDAGDPVEVAMAYDKAEADELVALDISATSENRDIRLDVIKNIVNSISIPLVVGGGIRNLEDIDSLLNVGVSKISINSAAIYNPDLIKLASKRFGREKIVIAIDAKKDENSNEWYVYASGGNNKTELEVIKWVKMVEELGAGEILLTSMDEDGKKQGYDIALTKAVSETVNIPVIASGGAGKMEDFYEVFTKTSANAALAASLFHFKEIEIPVLKEFLKEKGIKLDE